MHYFQANYFIILKLFALITYIKVRVHLYAEFDKYVFLQYLVMNFYDIYVLTNGKPYFADS